VSFSLGLYELFAYSVPGSLTLALLVYVGVRLDAVDLSKLLDTPSALLIVGAAVASYMLGHLVFAVGETIGRFLPFRRESSEVRESFATKAPGARNRAYVAADRHLLLAAVELHNRDAAAEIIRLRALGLMSRSLSVSLTLATVVALGELIAGSAWTVAAGCAIVFVAATTIFLWQGQVLQRWAYAKTLEVCYWLPNIDEDVQGATAHEPAQERHADEDDN